ncbi:MAG TPA: pyridoxal-phosphate dependent enzyme [Terriglobales bacterium]|nr:pyridoxal-phosphate dependent enzyme [Terriglobales bacterium]
MSSPAPTLAHAIRPTTLLNPDALSRHLGIRVTVAAETFQHTGSFKFRAAYNLALNVPQSKIIAASSGNFGQALAHACQLLGKQCTVVMPTTSAKVKLDAVRGYGAEVALVDTAVKTRASRVAELAAENPDAYIASAYDDNFVIEGNASLGAELAACGESWSAILVPIGGGGLISGIARGLRRAGNTTPLIGAEPALGNDAARSLRQGSIATNPIEPQTLADGARTLSVGKLNWEVIRREVADIIEVSEANIAQGLRALFSYANLKVEPTGALSVGALLENPKRFAGMSVCCVLSGGNVDPANYASLVSQKT